MNASSYETSHVQPATSRASIRTPTSVFLRGGTNIKKQTNKQTFQQATQE